MSDSTVTQENPYAGNSILYFLGAGASANAIPTVKDMADRFGLFSALFLFFNSYTFLHISNHEKNPDITDSLKEFVNTEFFTFDINCNSTNDGFKNSKFLSIHYFNSLAPHLYQEMKNSFSIDTFAKQAYLTQSKSEPEFDKNDFELTTIILKKYLQFEQGINLQKINELIKFLITFAKILNNHSISEIKTEIESHYRNELHVDGDKYCKIEENLCNFYQVISENLLINSTVNKKDTVDFRYRKFLLDVINNGSDRHKKLHFISWNYDTQFDLAAKRNGIDNFKQYQDLYNNTTRPNGSIKTDIKFAFENPDSNDPEINRVLDSWWRNKIVFIQMVVIGYSFPFYNRGIDTLLLRNIRNSYSQSSRSSSTENKAIPFKITIVESDIAGYERVKAAILALLPESNLIDYGIDYRFEPQYDKSLFFIPSEF